MTFLKSPAVAVMSVVLAAAPSFAQVPTLPAAAVPDSIRSEVLDFLASYYDAFSDREWGRFAEHFWEGATITTVWQPPGESGPSVVVTTVPEFVAQAPAGPGSREIFEERMLSAEVRARGNLALVYAKYRARFGDPDDVMEWEGLDAFTLLKHDGEWRIVSLAFAPEN